MVRILGEQITVRRAGKAPAQFVPQIFDVGLALNRLAVGEIRDRIIAADRQLGLLAMGAGREGCRKQQSGQSR